MYKPCITTELMVLHDFEFVLIIYFLMLKINIIQRCPLKTVYKSGE